MFRSIALALSLSILTVVADAHEYKLKALHIDHPLARATPPGARAADAFLSVENKGATPDRLIAASSPVAEIVEVHETTMDGGVMRMRAIPGIDINARSKVDLKPGGYHIMLMELKQPLKIGFGEQDYFSGKIRDVRLYQRALSDGEVEVVHSADKP